MSNEIAIAHDQFRTMGGAEHVACDIARELDAPIYAMRVDDDVVPEDVEVRRLSSERGEWVMRRHFLIQDAYQMLAWQHVDELYDYDCIVQTKTNPMWFVPRDEQTIVRYLHSTPRGMFDQFHRRGGDVIGDAMKTVQRMLYHQTVPYADHWVCNSDIVQRRLHRYFDVGETQSTVVYPGVEVGKTGPQMAETHDYLFTVGRLAVNKRIGLIRDVAERVDTEVVVAGDGPRKDQLVEEQPDNLTVLGYIDDDEKWRRLSEARATLMLAENEDFGIVPIESFAAGTPVIGANEGMTQHQIKQGKNGYAVSPNVDSVQAAIEDVEAGLLEWDDARIARYAEQFSTERFRREIDDIVTRVRKATTITPKLEVPPQRERVEADGGEPQ